MSNSHCKARRQSDQMHCSHCGTTWDVNDPDPPVCRKDPVIFNQEAGRRALDYIKELLRR